MTDDYTIKDAVYDVLMKKPKNTDFYFREFIREVKDELHMHGNPADPFDTSIQRAMRRLRASYVIKCVDTKKSIYRIVE